MPRWSNLSKVTKKRVKRERKTSFSFHFRVTSKFGVSQSYEKTLTWKSNFGELTQKARK